MFRTRLQVRYAETDRMGVVHHSRYFPWFESFIAFTSFVVILYKAFSGNEDKENKDDK